MTWSVLDQHPAASQAGMPISSRPALAALAGDIWQAIPQYRYTGTDYVPNLYLRRYSAGAWTIVGSPLDQDPSAGAWVPYLLASGTDLYVAWVELGTPTIWVAQWDGGSGWTILGSGLTDTVGSAGALAVDVNGDLNHIWTAAGGEMKARKWHSGAWSSTSTDLRVNGGATVNAVPAIDALSTGTLIAGWIEDTDYVFKKWNGSAWSAAGTITGSPDGASANSDRWLRVAASDDVWMITDEYDAGADNENITSYLWDGATTWTSQGTVQAAPPTGEYAFGGTLAFDAADQPHVIYCYASSSPTGSTLAANWDGAAWNAEGAVGGDNGESPSADFIGTMLYVTDRFDMADPDASPLTVECESVNANGTITADGAASGGTAVFDNQYDAGAGLTSGSHVTLSFTRAGIGLPAGAWSPVLTCRAQPAVSDTLYANTLVNAGQDIPTTNGSVLQSGASGIDFSPPVLGYADEPANTHPDLVLRTSDSFAMYAGRSSSPGGSTGVMLDKLTFTPASVTNASIYELAVLALPADPMLVCPAAEIAGDTVTIITSNPDPANGETIQYTLDGGSTWTTPDSLPIVLSGLAPGSYTIGVKLTNSLGDSGTVECSFALTTGGIQIVCVEPVIVTGGTGYPPSWSWTGPFDDPGGGGGSDPPTITSFTPSSGAAGDAIVVTGTLFTGATIVRIGGTRCSFTIDLDTQITLTIPDGAVTAPISVSTPGGTATSASDLTLTGTGGGGTASFTLADTDNGTITQAKTLWVYSRPQLLTQAELVQVAQDCVIVAGQFGSGAHAAAMVAANPTLLLGEYGKSIQKPITDSDVASLPELGFEHVTAGGYGTANRCTQGGQYHNYLMEGTRTASFPTVGGGSCANWAEYLLRRKLASAAAINAAAGSQVVTLLAYDSCGSFSFNLVTNGTPFDPATGAAYTLPAWLAMVRRFIDVQSGAINTDGLFIVANGIGITSAEEKKLLGHVDIGMSEGCLTSPSDTVNWPSTQKLEAAIDTLIYADSVGSGIWFLEKAWGTGWSSALWKQRCRYSAAAFMIGNRGGSVFEFSRSTTRSQYADIAPQVETARDSNLYTMNLGAPTSSPASAAAALVTVGTLQGYATATGLRRRYFTNGLVLHNETASTIRYVADDTLTDIDGVGPFAPGDLIAIPAHSGAFFTT